MQKLHITILQPERGKLLIMTLLKRLGNKSKQAKQIQAYFPPHKMYISTFFGAGGQYFNKPKAQFNICNDIDSDVFNLFQVVMNQKEDLKYAFFAMPIHNDLLKYWKKNKEVDPIKKALRFLFLSNFSLMGKMDTLSFKRANYKDSFYEQIENTSEMLYNVQFNNCDFRKFLKDISFTKQTFGKPSKERDEAFIYNDPPYLGTTSNYKDCTKWIEEDCGDLFDANEATGCKYAISEFNHPFILEQAKQRGLNVIEIGERRNLKNRRTEILVTNYEKRQMELNFPK